MKQLAIVTVMFIVGTTATAVAQQTAPFAGDRVVRVMARNVYHGVDAEIFAVPTATSLPDLLNKVAAFHRSVS